jgi:hypothetical protein
LSSATEVRRVPLVQRGSKAGKLTCAPSPVNVDSHVALLKATTAHHREVRGDAPLPIYVYASGLAV